MRQDSALAPSERLTISFSFSDCRIAPMSERSIAQQGDEGERGEDQREHVVVLDRRQPVAEDR